MESLIVHQGLGKMDMKRIDNKQFVLVFGKHVKDFEDIDDQIVCIEDRVVKEIATINNNRLSKLKPISVISQTGFDLVYFDIHPDIGYVNIAASDDKGGTFKDFVTPMIPFLVLFRSYNKYI